MSDEARIREAVTLYASFDEHVAADFGGGDLSVKTRRDDPDRKGEFIFESGYPESAFRIARDRGIAGGALEATDVLANRGRLFFPAAKNIGYRPDGWSGSVSFWLSCNPDTMLKTSFCDPVQITQRGASDGGLWIDFPETKPRSLRLGAFRGLEPGEKAIPEDSPDAPLVVVPRIGFQESDWHHVVMTWSTLDTGQPNARTALFIDGQPAGTLSDRDIAMKWDIERAGIYFAVNYIGLLDEFAVFNRELSSDDVQLLNQNPKLLGGLKSK